MTHVLPEARAGYQRQWRIFGALAVASVVTLFVGVAVGDMTPELGSSSKDIAAGLVHTSMASQFAGGYVEALSMFVFLAAATLLVRLLRGTTDWSRWLAAMMNATAVSYVAGTLAIGFPAGAAAIYAGHHGASLETITTVDDIRNFAFFLSIAVLGVFTVCTGAAILVTRAISRWLGWSGIVIGLLCVAAVAGARSGTHNIADLLRMIWWLLLAVVALRRPAGAVAESNLDRREVAKV